MSAADPPVCQNCLAAPPGHIENVCMLGVLACLLRDRGNLTSEQLQARLAECCVDALWDDLGPVIDRLEDGGYSEVGR